MYFTITTFGCKVNQYESSGLSELMKLKGFTETDDSGKADVHIINSCTVTENSDKKVRRLISAIKRDNPAAVTVLCGCFPKAFPEKAGLVGADMVVGGVLPSAFSPQLNRARAFLKIVDGCDRGCAYCVIPKARGSVKSRALPDIADEARKLAESGHKEIVLTGANLGLFGLDSGVSLYDAVKAVCLTDGIERVRLSSLEPDLIGGEFAVKIAGLPKLCRHFHISLQSGSDAVLRRMNRRYDTDYYAKLVASLREKFPDCAVTTDIIAGFPGETEREFAETTAFAESIGFAKIHVFAYSKREGTVAAAMPEQVPESVKRERAARLCELSDKTRGGFLKSLVGTKQEVLIEKSGYGHARNYAPVRVSGGDFRKNDILTVGITGVQEDCCLGVPEL